jgi:phosphoglycerol transferase MdoB-like AlkP superfamily enzyme
MFSIDKTKLKYFLPVSILLYILIAVILCTRGLDGLSLVQLPSTLLMPAIITLIGITNVNIKSNRAKAIISVLLFLYMPAYLLNFVMNNNNIMVHQGLYFNWLLIGSLLLLFMALTLSIRATAIIISVLFFLIFTIDTWVTDFRGTAITPSDIYAIGTAMKVSGGYTLFISMPIVNSLMYGIVIIQLACKLTKPLRFKKIYKNIAVRAAFLIASVAAMVVFANARGANLYGYDGFDVDSSNHDFGIPATFATNLLRTLNIMPDGYSQANAEDILQSVEPYDQPKATVDKPNVIAIMNESFCDIGDIYSIEPSSDPLEYWHSLTENTISGNMRVSVQGGGTSNTEFEFLTGIGGGIIDMGFSPYTNYVHRDTYSLVRDFKSAGYKAIAVHPFWSTCWNRNLVYPFLGFDDFISGEDFNSVTMQANNDELGTNRRMMLKTNFGDGLDYVRDFISDKESYNKVIEQFENKDKDEKLFVFNVTVQNHGDYTYEGDNFNTDVTSATAEEKRADQYLSLLKYSDEAYKGLIEYFQNYDEPTVILMFGDHQPSIGYIDCADDTHLQDDYLQYYDNDEFQYIVPYKLWANFDIEEQQRDITGASFLSLTLKDVTGLPYNKWDDLRANLNTKFEAITSRGFYLPDNAGIYSGNNEETDELISRYKIAEYYILMDQGLLNKE